MELVIAREMADLPSGVIASALMACSIASTLHQHTGLTLETDPESLLLFKRGRKSLLLFVRGRKSLLLFVRELYTIFPHFIIRG